MGAKKKSFLALLYNNDTNMCMTKSHLECQVVDILNVK